MHAPLPALPALRHERAKGIMLRLGAIVGFAIMAAMIKIASARGAEVPELMFYRCFFGLPPLLAWILVSRNWTVLETSRPMAHLVRGLIGLASMGLAFMSLVLLPLAEATTISFAAPLIALALSSPLLGERVGLGGWAAVLTGFAGVLIVVQPGGDLPLVGTLVALASAFGVACISVAIRSLSRTESTQTIVLWFTLFSTAATGALMPWFGQAHDAATWALLVAIGLVGGTSQIFLTGSLRFAPIAALAPIDYLQLVLAVLFGWMLFDAQPALTTGLGAAVIIASVLATLRRWRQEPPTGAEI